MTKINTTKVAEFTAQEPNPIHHQDFGKTCKMCKESIRSFRTVQARVNNLCQKCQDGVKL